MAGRARRGPTRRGACGEMPVRALACARGGETYGPWVPKIQPMSNGAALTLGPLRLVARWSLRTADHAGRFSFLIADMLRGLDRKSTRLNSSHLVISYAVFCLKKKTQAYYELEPI